MNSSLSLEEPVELFRYLRQLVDTAQAAGRPYPKFALVEAYWHLGRIIVEVEQQGQERADYGIHLIESLSQQLTEVFGKGYGLSNMWRFKEFFLAFPILATNGREFTDLRQHLRTELTWSHYRLLMNLADSTERAFYMQQAADEGWTVRFMQRMVRTRYYYQVALEERRLLPPSPTHPTRLVPQTLSVIRGSARTRVANLKKLLLERYVGWALVAQRQFVSVAGEDRWAELVFYLIPAGRYVLVQLGEPGPAAMARLRALVDAYTERQPPGHENAPVGMLVDSKGGVTPVAATVEAVLSPVVAACLPRQFT